MPQALLTLLVACDRLQFCNKAFSIKAYLAKAWEERLTSQNAIVASVKHNLGIFRPDDFLLHLNRYVDVEVDICKDSITIVWPDQQLTKCAVFPCESFNEFLLRRGFPSHCLDKWGIFIDGIDLFLQGKDTFPQGQLRGSFVFGEIPPLFKIDVIVLGQQPEGESLPSTVPWTNPAVGIDESLCRFTVTLPTSQTSDLECFASRTVEELLYLAGFNDASHGMPRAFVEHQQIDLDVLVGSIGAKSIVFSLPGKRKHQDAKDMTMIEIVLFEGRTKFIHVHCDDTISAALIDAGLPPQLLPHIAPENCGKFLSIDTPIKEIITPLIRLRSFLLKGGMEVDQKDKNNDPLSKNDPWSEYNLKGKAIVRWDQLKLPKNHPFFVEGVRLKQVAAMQIGPEFAGMSFAAKATAQNLLNAVVTKPTVLLLPGFKGMTQLSHELKSLAMAPCQIVVPEPDAQTQYKGKCDYKIDEPTNVIKIKSDQFVEMVLEIPSKIVNQSTKQALSERPIEVFQKLLHSSGILMTEASVYAFRKLKSQDGEETYQTLAKVPDVSRTQLLQFSGYSELFVRQFVNDPADLDHSILPRYFDVNAEGIRSARQLGETIPNQGFRGLAWSSRGFFLSHSRTSGEALSVI